MDPVSKPPSFDGGNLHKKEAIKLDLFEVKWGVTSGRGGVEKSLYMFRFTLFAFAF